MSRTFIAALQISLDGYTQGEDTGEPSWVESWADALQLVPDVDCFVQGGGMYPGYGMYWAAIEADPKAPPPFQTQPPTPQEVAYARFAGQTPHYVLSKTLETVSWPPTARIVRNLDALRKLKAEPGKNTYVVGGATFVSSLLQADLIDELKLIVHPLLLGGGKRLFGPLEKRRSLRFVKSEPAKSGRVILSYRL
ncbi:MAG: dihydrofolate reductase [Polyangiaceae bacterium]|nr:dihydrofolate reductase [Polyangiaceae bacterium]